MGNWEAGHPEGFGKVKRDHRTICGGSQARHSWEGPKNQRNQLGIQGEQTGGNAWKKRSPAHRGVDLEETKTQTGGAVEKRGATTPSEKA